MIAMTIYESVIFRVLTIDTPICLTVWSPTASGTFDLCPVDSILGPVQHNPLSCWNPIYNGKCMLACVHAKHVSTYTILNPFPPSLQSLAYPWLPCHLIRQWSHPVPHTCVHQLATMVVQGVPLIARLKVLCMLMHVGLKQFVCVGYFD